MKNQILCITTRIGLGREIEMNCLRLLQEKNLCLTPVHPTLSLPSEPTCLFIAVLNGALKCFYSLASEPGYVSILSLSGGGAAFRIPLFSSVPSKGVFSFPFFISCSQIAYCAE